MIWVLVESVIAIVVDVVDVVDGGRWSNKRGVNQLFNGAGRISRWRRRSRWRIGWGLGLSVLEEGHDLVKGHIQGP
jgi:hypothetical protein